MSCQGLDSVTSGKGHMEIDWGGAEAEPQERWWWWWSGDLRQLGADRSGISSRHPARHRLVEDDGADERGSCRTKLGSRGTDDCMLQPNSHTVIFYYGARCHQTSNGMIRSGEPFVMGCSSASNPEQRRLALASGRNCRQCPVGRRRSQMGKNGDEAMIRWSGCTGLLRQ